MLRTTTFVLSVLSLTTFVSSAAAAAQSPRNVILFGWDAAQREHVKQCLARKELPSLQNIIDKGCCVEIDIEGKTDTKAGYAQILSGYYPEVTGVYSDNNYHPIPKGLSIFERLENHFGPDKLVTAAIFGSSENVGYAPPGKIKVSGQNNNSKAGRIKKETIGSRAKQPNLKNNKKFQGTYWRENGIRYRVVPGQPFYNTKKGIDLFETGVGNNQKVGLRVIELLEKYNDSPFFFFVQFAEAEQAGSKHGENSKEYNDALISNDFWTGKITAKVRELGLGNKTQYYITADHGFNEGEKQHSFAPYVLLATDNKKVNRNGRRQDVAPTIMEAFGLNLNSLRPALDGISLTKPDRRPAAKISPDSRKPDVLYVPTPQKVVDKMLEMAKVTKDDLVYDLGCGDGRFVVTAAKRYGCRAVGYDISPRRVRESRQNVKKNGLEHLVRIEQKDIFTLDLSKADVITLFLLPSLNVKLIPQLDKLKPCSRIVSYNFGMRGVIPDQTVKFTGEDDKSQHKIYLWTTPLKKVWLLKNKPPSKSVERR